MFKNVASKITFFVFDSTTGLPKTGDGANLTAYVSKDFGAVTVLADTSATEDDSTNAKGNYTFDLAQGETNGDDLKFTCKSATSNIVCVPRFVATTPNRFTTMVIDAAGLVDANVVKVGPTGSGTAQTARDVGASVLLSTGTGTGQLDFTSGVVKANATQWLGGTIPAVNVTGVPIVDDKYLLGTVYSTPATAGIQDINVKNMNNVAATPITTIKAVQGLTTADTIATYTGNTKQTGDVYAALPANFSALVIDATGRVNAFLVGILTSVFTEGATGRIAAAFKQFFNIASPAATMDHGILTDTVTTATTATNLTNAPTNGDLTATMKTSVTTAATAATPTAAAVTGAVGSVTAGVTVTTNNDKTGMRLSATGVADIWAYVVEGAHTAVGYMRLFASALAAKLSGAATTTVTIRDIDDSKARITATVDSSGNRSAVTVDET